ncbi:hypothetical protein A6P39_026370 [Streptomyces sp. FXJ1.172]|uniref:hypothetical protein n=1 Tax=Streptomyces sp. FXJ1.172 TaxID=710705 RepID=UPI0007CFD640|nr:hypothetical protein [Streptomyces sp. FXJ1.172]WEO97253.1 hypothetical protein A6P39_026370 [Streptomyces sp. FXJ1.172]
MPGPRSTSAPRPVPDSASEVIRWAAFSCVLVPVVLVWYGTSLAGAAGAALGLAAVTAACRILLRESERGAARRARRSGTQSGGRHTRRRTPVD